MGRVASRLTKPVRTFNIENRAAKAFKEQADVPKAAPKHPSSAGTISQFQYEHPEYLEAQQTKNEALHENLKHIYVDSKDTQMEIKSASKPLPTSRKAVQESDLGSMDIDYTIPDGRVDLKTILGFIGQHQLDPTTVTAARIADQHKLDVEEVENVLKYFKAFQLHIPQAMYKENPKLKKAVAEQMSVSSGVLSPFSLSSGEDQKQLEDGSQTDPATKT